MKSVFKVAGLGEVLWDLLPTGKQLGGAPTNFAYMTSLLGDEGIVTSRVGRDPLGQEIVETATRLGLGIQDVQFDEIHPTGTVNVTVDDAGQPRFTITESVAWDFLEWTPAWKELAGQTDVVCFGSLAQRSSTSRETIGHFLRALPENALRIFDVNLRQKFFSAEVLAESCHSANVVKLNHEELPVVAGLLGLTYGNEETCARRLLDRFGLRLICITRGGGGSFLANSSEVSTHPGYKIKVADTVGAGDAFTACLAHHYLRGASLAEINEQANQFAAWVASQPGGTPSLKGRSLQETLKQIKTS